MNETPWHAENPCRADNCDSEALYCDLHATPNLSALKRALWECFYHMELNEIHHNFDLIDGNDHPVFQRLAENIIDRYVL